MESVHIQEKSNILNGFCATRKRPGGYRDRSPPPPASGLPAIGLKTLCIQGGFKGGGRRGRAGVPPLPRDSNFFPI